MRLPFSIPGSVSSRPRALSRVRLLALSAAGLNVVMALLVATVSRRAGGMPWAVIVLVAVVSGAAAAAAFVVLLSRDSSRLVRLRGLVAAVNAGDLTVSTASTSRDELGELERGIDDLLGRMRVIVSTVQQGLVTFNEGRKTVAGTHKSMLDASEMTAGQAYDAGVSAEQVSGSIDIVASSTEELVATVNEIARHATFAADVAVTAATEGEVADAGVRELSMALQQVESIANVISTIAHQTHLLALNATIEAARAGDAGLGFGVVAAEVKELARATAEATERVRAVVSGIHEGSSRASEALAKITGTMSLICESTASIASSVTQQTATTHEIGRVSVIAAQGARDISGRVTAVHDRARDVAYVGAQNDATKAAEFEMLEDQFRDAVGAYNLGSFAVEMRTYAAEIVDQEALNSAGVSTEDGVTTVLDTVIGDGLNQWQYTGAWLHGTGYETDPGGDAYCSIPGDSIEMRFVGRRFRYVGCKDQQQGVAEVWIDRQAPTEVDLYAPVRGHQVLWESAELAPGEHTFHLRVSQKKNPQSRYFWISLAKAEIVQ
ncbi:MAG: methyl-accepting chemotaxis protein [Mycobacteriales bacterium]